MNNYHLNRALNHHQDFLFKDCFFKMFEYSWKWEKKKKNEWELSTWSEVFAGWFFVLSWHCALQNKCAIYQSLGIMRFTNHSTALLANQKMRTLIPVLILLHIFSCLDACLAWKRKAKLRLRYYSLTGKITSCTEWMIATCTAKNLKFGR